MKKRNKRKYQPEIDDQEFYFPYQEEYEPDQDLDNMYNLGPTGHGPDICHSDADPVL